MLNHQQQLQKLQITIILLLQQLTEQTGLEPLVKGLKYVQMEMTRPRSVFAPGPSLSRGTVKTLTPGHFPHQQMSLAQSQLQTISPIPVTAESQASSSGVLTPRPPPAVLQHPIKLCGPQSTEIRLMLQGLMPIPITILTSAISWPRHSPKSDMDTFTNLLRIISH